MVLMALFPNFVTAWKASSIVLTGAFGVLGLVKDFKDKKGKITKWGRISLVGILLSTGLGVIAQLMESSKAERTERETAAQTLGIVRDIQRGLSPLDEPTFRIEFSQDCTAGYKEFCEELKSLPLHATGNSGFPDAWKHWPVLGDGFSMLVKIDFFVDPKDAGLFLNFTKGTGDLWFEIDPTPTPTNYDYSLVAMLDDNGALKLTTLDAKVKSFGSNGKLKSILDMPGVTAIVTEYTAEDLDVRKVVKFRMTFKNGQVLSYPGPFEKVQRGNVSAYRFKFPVPSQTR
jgi:hypothetical protein